MNNITTLLPPATQIVPEEQISLPRLSNLLNAAYIDHSIDEDGDIYVSDTLEFPVWLTVVETAKLVCMYTFLEPEGVPEDDLLSRINACNGAIMLPQFSCSEGKMIGRYHITYDGGLNVRHFIKMLRRFSGACELASRETSNPTGILQPNA